MIELHHVTKTYPTRYGERVVLNDICSTFPACTNVGVLGLNGAGKSTLLRVLSGTEQPDAGHIQRHGRISWPLGFTGGFSGSLTGAENCQFVARVYGANEDDVTAFAIDFADLGTYFEMPVRTYSSGMRARLAFALSMAIDFDVYLVDEVTAVGDRRFQDKCRSAFAERSDRSSIILVSHNLATVRSYCTECAVLYDGRLTHFDSVDEAAAVYETLQ
jgi:capsular polysaccharide transport system ATP-binding protein